MPRLFPVLLIAAALGLSTPSQAQDPFTLSLLTQDSLDGWDHGAQPIVGWSNSGGTLRGGERSTPLLAGWTLGEQFDLLFRWSAGEGGVLRLAFPNLDGGARYDLLLSESDSCGALFCDNQLLAAGANIPRSEEGHSAVLRRQGAQWQLFVDNKLVTQATVSPTARLGIQLSVAEGEASIAELRLDEPLGVPIFNGLDQTGWWTPRNPASWPIVNGEITCINRSGDYLRSEQEYGNFTLSCEYKMRRGGNSGIGIRTARNAWPSGDGMELQLLDEPPGAELTRSSTMGIYGNLAPFARADLSEQWNRVVVKAEGYMISAWVNGVLVQHVNTARLPELKHRPLRGWVGFQDHGAWIRVRNVNLLEGPEGAGPSAWYARRAEDASQLVLDRLMNPERLAIEDGTRSSALVASVDGRGEQVLADLAGPGAVVMIESTRPSGRIACYFDGETEPRIDCRVGDLAAHLPDVASSPGAWATFLAYQQGMKIVLRDAEPGEYRIEHVALSPSTPVSSFRDKRQSIARGMLPALSYRYQQMESGRVRDDDPLPRKTSSPQRIEPGSRVPLVEIEGAGTVQWWRLSAPRGTLANDDLWVEITVDGESQPAISAPARYLFPGMMAPRGYRNFAVTNFEGLLHRLAIPFGNGVTIAAVNRGSAPLNGIAASASYSPQTSDSRDSSRMRLRGVWQAGSDDDAPLFIRQGRGRLVALVCQQPQSASGTVELFVDGSSAAGSQAPLERWLRLPDGGDEVRAGFCGRHAGLVWRFFQLAPLDFNQSIELRSTQGAAAGARLALFYAGN